jgi:predicted Fe-Mo cluster-binding NifX family protein
MRIAVASSDGKFVNQHFGRATQFLILDVMGDSINIVELRENLPPCGASEYGGHDDDALARAIALIADCQAVLCSRIGIGTRSELLSHGIEPVEARDFVEEAVRSYIQHKKGM